MGRDSVSAEGVYVFCHVAHGLHALAGFPRDIPAHMIGHIGLCGGGGRGAQQSACRDTHGKRSSFHSASTFLFGFPVILPIVREGYTPRSF